MQECTHVYTPRAIRCYLEKAEQGPFWTRLLKENSKPHYLHVDFSRWVDEDYEDEDPEAERPIDQSAFMNMAQMGGMPGYDGPDLDDESSGDEESNEQ